MVCHRTRPLPLEEQRTFHPQLAYHHCVPGRISVASTVVTYPSSIHPHISLGPQPPHKNLRGGVADRITPISLNIEVDHRGLKNLRVTVLLAGNLALHNLAGYLVSLI